MQMLERWECIVEAQPDRHFLVGVVMGRDGIDLWRFSKSGHKHTGVWPLNWNQGDIGWQVRKWKLPINIRRPSMSIDVPTTP
jgi:hypothetical protein